MIKLKEIRKINIIKVLLLFITIFFFSEVNAFFQEKNELYKKGSFVYVYREKWRPAKIIKKIFYNGENYYHITFVGLSKYYDVWAKENRMHLMKQELFNSIKYINTLIQIKLYKYRNRHIYDTY